MNKTYWILLQSVYGKEMQAEADLISDGYEVYLPRKLTDIRTRRHRRTIVEALYPSYLFCYVYEGETDLHPVKKIARIVHFGADMAIASDSLIATLKSKEDAQGVHETKHDYSEGDTVSLKSGQWQGYNATIERLGKRDRAMIHFLTTGKSIEVSLSQLEPAA